MEEETWPDEAAILSIMSQGFTYSEAWHMSWRDYLRYSGLATAWAIPPDQRDNLVLHGTRDDAARLL